MQQGEVLLPAVTSCEVCGAARLERVLDLGRHPLCDDLVPVGIGRTCREYPIEILLCTNCLTAHQRFQVPKQELFPDTYHYRSRFTADVLHGMQSLVAAVKARLGPLSGKLVLDVGCNDGSLLEFFSEEGARTLGIEPTGAHLDAKRSGHTVYPEYITPDLARRVVAAYGHPDVVTFTNVFAHIEKLDCLIEAVAALMGPQTLLVIENHYLGSILSTAQFDTFYHEHPRTYSARSFGIVAGRLQAHLLNVEFPSRYGGNIRVTIGADAWRDAASVEDPILIARESGFPRAFLEMQLQVGRWKATKQEWIRHHVATNGPLIAKAFPGRAAILLKLLDLDDDSIEAVYEKPGSMKIGHYVPGTRIPIRSDAELFAAVSPDRPILNLAWHIGAEIRAYLAEHGFRGKVWDILTAEDLR